MGEVVFCGRKHGIWGREVVFCGEKDPILGRRCPTSGRKVVSWESRVCILGRKVVRCGRNYHVVWEENSILWLKMPCFSETNVFICVEDVVLLERSIESDHRKTEWPGLKKDLKDHGVSTPPAKCTGSPTSRPGCAEPHPAWAPMPPGMRHPQPPWAAGFQCVTPLGVKNVFVLSHLNAPCLSSSPVSNRSPS